MQIRNKKKILFISILSLFFFNINLNAEEFNITAKEILLDKENEILVGKGTVEAKDSDGNIISADKITYEKQEEFLLAEMARLHTLLALYEGREEFMKAAIIKRRLEIVQNKLDNYGEQDDQADAGPQIWWG